MKNTMEMRNELSENELDMVNGGGVMDSLKEFWDATQEVREVGTETSISVAKWGLTALFGGPIGVVARWLC